jgi:hypothetical protein
MLYRRVSVDFISAYLYLLLSYKKTAKNPVTAASLLAFSEQQKMELT